MTFTPRCMRAPARIVRNSSPQLNSCRVDQAMAPPSKTGETLAVRNGALTARNQANAFFRRSAPSLTTLRFAGISSASVATVPSTALLRTSIRDGRNPDVLRLVSRLDGYPSLGQEVSRLLPLRCLPQGNRLAADLDLDRLVAVSSCRTNSETDGLKPNCRARRSARPSGKQTVASRARANGTSPLRSVSPATVVKTASALPQEASAPPSTGPGLRQALHGISGVQKMIVGVRFQQAIVGRAACERSS